MDVILRNLLRYPPVEGSKQAHEAWKQNVCMLMGHATLEKVPLINELVKPGFVSATLRNACISYEKSLPSERK